MRQQQLKLNANIIGMQLVGLSMQHRDIIFQRCVSETRTFRTSEMLFSTFTSYFFLSSFCFASWPAARAGIIWAKRGGQRHGYASYSSEERVVVAVVMMKI